MFLVRGFLKLSLNSCDWSRNGWPRLDSVRWNHRCKLPNNIWGAKLTMGKRKFNLLRIQARKRGNISLNRFVIYIHPSPNSHSKFLAPPQISSKKSWIENIFFVGWGICPPLPPPNLRLRIKLFSWNDYSLHWRQRNVCSCLPNYTASYPRRQHSSQSLPWESHRTFYTEVKWHDVPPKRRYLATKLHNILIASALYLEGLAAELTYCRQQLTYGE